MSEPASHSSAINDNSNNVNSSQNAFNDSTSVSISNIKTVEHQHESLPKRTSDLIPHPKIPTIQSGLNQITTQETQSTIHQNVEKNLFDEEDDEDIFTSSVLAPNAVHTTLPLVTDVPIQVSFRPSVPPKSLFDEDDNANDDLFSFSNKPSIAAQVNPMVSFIPFLT